MNQIAERMYSTKSVDGNTRIRVGVAVVVRDSRGWILLERRSDCGLWGLPGGGIEPGESVLEAAIREVKEETGLVVKINGLIGVYSEPSERIVTYLDNGDVCHLIDVVLDGTIESGELTRSEESEAVQFFEPAALPLELVPPARKPIRDALLDQIGQIR